MENRRELNIHSRIEKLGNALKSLKYKEADNGKVKLNERALLVKYIEIFQLD